MPNITITRIIIFGFFIIGEHNIAAGLAVPEDLLLKMRGLPGWGFHVGNNVRDENLRNNLFMCAAPAPYNNPIVPDPVIGGPHQHNMQVSLDDVVLENREGAYHGVVGGEAVALNLRLPANLDGNLEIAWNGGAFENIALAVQPSNMDCAGLRNENTLKTSVDLYRAEGTVQVIRNFQGDLNEGRGRLKIRVPEARLSRPSIFNIIYGIGAEGGDSRIGVFLKIGNADSFVVREIYQGILRSINTPIPSERFYDGEHVFSNVQLVNKQLPALDWINTWLTSLPGIPQALADVERWINARLIALQNKVHDEAQVGHIIDGAGAALERDRYFGVRVIESRHRVMSDALYASGNNTYVYPIAKEETWENFGERASVFRVRDYNYAEALINRRFNKAFVAREGGLLGGGWRAGIYEYIGRNQYRQLGGLDRTIYEIHADDMGSGITVVPTDRAARAGEAYFEALSYVRNLAKVVVSEDMDVAYETLNRGLSRLRDSLVSLTVNRHIEPGGTIRAFSYIQYMAFFQTLLPTLTALKYLDMYYQFPDPSEALSIKEDAATSIGASIARLPHLTSVFMTLPYVRNYTKGSAIALGIPFGALLDIGRRMVSKSFNEHMALASALGGSISPQLAWIKFYPLYGLKQDYDKSNIRAAIRGARNAALPAINVGSI